MFGEYNDIIILLYNLSKLHSNAISVRVAVAQLFDLQDRIHFVILPVSRSKDFWH